MRKILLRYLLFLVVFSSFLGNDVFADTTVFVGHTEEDFVSFHLKDTHPIKKKLDKLFGKKRISVNKKHLKKAGFQIIKSKGSNFYVMTHHSMPGYIFKIYSDEEDGKNEFDNFRNRINGSVAVRHAIKEHGWGSVFTVPEKRLYLIPKIPVPEGYRQRKYLLVCEKMNIVSKEENLSRWHSKSRMNRSLVKKIYTMLEEVGLWDSTIPANLFFTVHGRIAILDTEYYHMWPVRYHKLTRFMHPELRPYWETLIKQSKG